MWKGIFRILRISILPLLAIAGLVGAIFSVVVSAESHKPLSPYKQPTELPNIPPAYAAEIQKNNELVAATGLAEPSSENINIGTNLGGVVSAVYVKEGQTVHKNDPLFTIDDTEAKATVEAKKAAVEVAQAKLQQAIQQVGYVNAVEDKRAVSRQEVSDRKDNAKILAAQLLQAQADYDEASATLALHTVRSPIDGEVLQLNIHPGEYAQTGELSTTLMVLGTLHPLYVRINVDEYDLGRVHNNPRALISPRGNPSIRIPATFVRVVPLVIPKQNLTGSANELVDTRVLQILFVLDNKAPPLFPGEQVDAYISSPKNAPLLSQAWADNEVK